MKDRKIVFTSLVISLVCTCRQHFAQTEFPEKPASVIAGETIAQNAAISQNTHSYVYFLAGKEAAGRGTGSKESVVVEQFLAKRLAENGFTVETQEFKIPLVKSKYFVIPYQARFDFSHFRRVRARNIIGTIEGRDNELKDQIVILCAHYDHLGHTRNIKFWAEALFTAGLWGFVFPSNLPALLIDNAALNAGLNLSINELYRARRVPIPLKRSTFYGADDNASGTAAILTVVDALGILMKQGIYPRRTIKICFFGAEELGLLGSRHFLKTLNRKELSNIVAAINLDMVGRNEQNELYVAAAPGMNPLPHNYVLIQFLEDANEAMVGERASEPLILIFVGSEHDDVFKRSDAYNFFRKRKKNQRIPTLTLFSGFHKNYHKPSDTAEKIDFKKLDSVSRLAFLLGWYTANEDIRPIYVDDPRR